MPYAQDIIFFMGTLIWKGVQILSILFPLQISNFLYNVTIIAIGQKMKSVMLPSDGKSTMSLTSEESIQAGENVIERGIFKIQYSDGSLNDQGK